jgi:hypothetical protein
MKEKVLHDLLLALKPDDVVHEAESCPLCVEQVTSEKAPHQGGEMSTYTKEDLDKAVAEALAPLQKELDDMKQVQAQSETANAIEDLKAEHAVALTAAEESIKDLQSKLDAAVLEAQSSKEESTQLVAYLEGIVAEETEKAEKEQIKAERLEKLKSSVSFPDEYLEANADRFAAMSQEDFDAALADWLVVAPAKEQESTETAFKASRTERVTAGSHSTMREVMRLNLNGIDPRTL